jgi:predicted CopG family antitoxin
VAKVKADAYGELSDYDLNNDGFSDMVIYYPTSKERKGTLEVLINLRKIN